jgi:hypothetical protein
MKGLILAAPNVGTLAERRAHNLMRCHMSKAAGFFHVLLTIGNWAICVAQAAADNYGSAAIAGVIAGILSWQFFCFWAHDGSRRSPISGEDP